MSMDRKLKKRFIDIRNSDILAEEFANDLAEAYNFCKNKKKSLNIVFRELYDRLGIGHGSKWILPRRKKGNNDFRNYCEEINLIRWEYKDNRFIANPTKRMLGLIKNIDNNNSSTDHTAVEHNPVYIDQEEPKDSALLLLAQNPFYSNNAEDARIKTQVMRVLRQGQPKFRAELMEIYQGTCVISGCDITHVLEAAHILPYFGEKSNHKCNGLLLRCDIHTLFDMNLIIIDSDSFVINVDKSLFESIYWEFQGKKVHFPKEIAEEISNTLKKKKEGLL